MSHSTPKSNDVAHRIPWGRLWFCLWLLVGSVALFGSLRGTTTATSLSRSDTRSYVSAKTPLCKNIEDIEVGDVVLAYDFQTRKPVPRRVTHVHKHFTDLWVDVFIDHDKITATALHQFWVENEGEWREACQLEPGMTVRLSDGRDGLVSHIAFRRLSEPEATYNLEVEDHHNYYVGHDHVLVHNGPAHSTTGYWNYWLTHASGRTYYHGMAGPNETQADVEYRHSNNNDRFSRANGDDFHREPGTRNYGDSRRMEHERIIRDGTRIGRDPNTYRGNRQSGISERNMKNYYPKKGC